MYTYCPNCKSIFEVLPEHLSVANGMIQCGQCNQVFNALESLSDKIIETHSPIQEEKGLVEPEAVFIPESKPTPKPESDIKEDLFEAIGIFGESLDMSNLKSVRAKIMEYYHRKILKFYKGINKTIDLPHLHFENMKSPQIILHDEKTVFIGHIEVDGEGVSNFIHNIPLVIGNDDKFESISMQDFMAQGRLTSLSTIRQKYEDNPDKEFYAYQTIDDEKGEKLVIFPLLRANSTQTSYMLRKHLNLLLDKKVKQLDLTPEQDEYGWIEQNGERFEDVCKRLDIAMFKDSNKITLMLYNSLNQEQ